MLAVASALPRLSYIQAARLATQKRYSDPSVVLGTPAFSYH